MGVAVDRSPGYAGPVPGHQTFRIEALSTRPARCVAVCSCGWRSDPSSSAGVAGAKWDAHRAVADDRRDAAVGYRPPAQLDG